MQVSYRFTTESVLNLTGLFTLQSQFLQKHVLAIVQFGRMCLDWAEYLNVHDNIYAEV